MKKRIVFLLAAAASCAITFSACSGCSGCNGNSANAVALGSNWFPIPSYKGVQPWFIEGNDNFAGERLTYDVKFVRPELGNSSYSVKYADGTYVTEFYAKRLDRSYFDEEYAAGFAEETVAYYYRTELNIPEVEFSCKGERVTKQGECVITECYFMPCADDLRPIWSKQTIKSTTPANLTATNIDNCYIEIDREYETFYNNYDRVSDARARTVMRDNLNSDNDYDRRVTLSSDSSLFDISSLNIVIRAMNNLTPSLSQQIGINTLSAGVQNFNLVGSPASLEEAERTDITSLLKREGLYADREVEEGEKNEVNTVAVNVIYGGSLSGVMQTYWFSAIESNTNNIGKATLLKISTPLAYGLGTLDYTLSDIEKII